jgi:hypothetical protein
MKKNIVFTVNVDLAGKGRWASTRKDPYKYSIRSWQKWCEKNNAELFVLDECLVDHNEMGLCWQRYYLFDILEANDIDYDQVLIVDADTIVHPDCPNFFELTDRKLTGVHNDGSYDWVLRSLENYSQHLFQGYMSKWWNYVDCGFVIVNSSHKDFFKSFVNMYWQNKDTIKQIETLHTGTDQTPFNIFLEQQDIDLQILPYEFNMVDMHRKELLQEDLPFTEIGHVFHYNSIPGNKDDQLTLYWMKKTYEKLYGQYEN